MFIDTSFVITEIHEQNSKHFFSYEIQISSPDIFLHCSVQVTTCAQGIHMCLYILVLYCYRT